jgi:hypothetical protein
MGQDLYISRGQGFPAIQVRTRWPDQPSREERLRLRQLWLRRKSELHPPLNPWQIWFADPLDLPIVLVGPGSMVRHPPGFDGWCWSKAETSGGEHYTGFRPRPAIVLSGGTINSQRRAWLAPTSKERFGRSGEVDLISLREETAARLYWIRSVSTKTGPSSDLLRFQEDVKPFYREQLHGTLRNVLLGSPDEAVGHHCIPRGCVITDRVNSDFHGLVVGTFPLRKRNDEHPHILYVAQQLDALTVSELTRRGDTSIRDVTLEKRALLRVHGDQGDNIFALALLRPVLCVTAEMVSTINEDSSTRLSEIIERCVGELYA